MRKIIHIDMDSFFASVEQRDFPQYKGKPLVVGGKGPRSVVAAASYEARKYGVRSAMPMSIALRRCPHLIIAPVRFNVYKEVSTVIQNIFHEYTDLVEPLSLDEAYLDVTQIKKGPPSASLIAMHIKRDIQEQTGLIASAGVSYNKFLAKVASDMDKPDGFYLIKPEDAQSFIDNLAVGLFFGVGKKTEQKMQEMGITRGRHLKALSRPEIMRNFGKSGSYFYNVVRGIDERPVRSHRERKSVGAERTFETDIFDIDTIKEKLSLVIDKMWERCSDNQKIGKTITLKIRFSDFNTITRSKTYSDKTYNLKSIETTTIDLLPTKEIEEQGIRLIGVTMSNFNVEKRKDPLQLQIEFD